MDKARQRVYCALLLFVFAAGLPMVAFAPLRNRLLGRIETLKVAVTGKSEPASMTIGEYYEPLPPELEKALQPRAVLPPSDVVKKVYSMTPGSQTPITPSARVSSGRPTRKLGIYAPPAAANTESEALHAPELNASEGGELDYKTGAREQEAYQILLRSNPVLEALIHGSNSNLRFKSWDAAFRGNEIYWVRIIFQSEANTDAEYIWQVNLETKQAAPLNFNARTLF